MPTIRIDDEVWQALQKKAIPLEDTPNAVLRRLLRLGPTRRDFPRAGTLKAKAAELYRMGKTASEAAEELSANKATFRSWWRQFKKKGLKIER